MIIDMFKWELVNFLFQQQKMVDESFVWKVLNKNVGLFQKLVLPDVSKKCGEILHWKKGKAN